MSNDPFSLTQRGNECDEDVVIYDLTVGKSEKENRRMKVRKRVRGIL